MLGHSVAKDLVGIRESSRNPPLSAGGTPRMEIQNIQRSSSWKFQVSLVNPDLSNYPYKGIKKLHLSVTVLPSSYASNTRFAAQRILEEELHTPEPAYNVVHNIARRALREIPNALESFVAVRLRSSDGRAVYTSYELALSPSNDPDKEHGIVFTESQWRLSLVSPNTNKPYEQTVRMHTMWPDIIISKEHQPASRLPSREEQWRQRLKSRSKPGPSEVEPPFELHQEAADFVESKTHPSTELLALETAHIVLQPSDPSDGSSPFRRFNISFGDYMEDGDFPKIHSSYRFNSSWLKSFRLAQTLDIRGRADNKAYIALGSNVGDRTGTIEQACKEMTSRGLRVRRTSSLYETEPMYKTDQQSFINGACEIETTLSPVELLDQLKDIEATLGRVKTVRNGPRTIDLDILLYNNEIIDIERLQIPHPRISERVFVLKPLCDLIPHSFLPQPSVLLDFSSQLAILSSSSSHISSRTPLTRLAPSSVSPRFSPILASGFTNRETQLMAILNLTPDSFSHDGKHTPTFDPSSLLPQLHSLLHHRVPILDIGGQSTRPHASPLSAEEELARILPMIQYIRSDPIFDKIHLSIDTYHSSVARACVQAGADIINDVSGGLMDPKMFSMVAELGCTYILMHMRGTPETMNTMTSYPDGVVDGVATELDERVQQAMKAGIRRWRIVLDPGIGFAKTGPQNLELMRKLPELREREGLKGLPWCVGVSRKRFIGKVTRVPGDAGREEEVEEVKEDSEPNYLDTDIESGEKEKWVPTLMREDEPQNTDTETRSSEESKTRRKKNKVAEESKGIGPPHYHLDIHSNANTATTSSSTSGLSYTNTDSDPTTNSNRDTNTITTNPPSPSSSPVGPRITEPPQS
ncbi:MAG: hypothetical protein Q9198_003417, partial [Flavoplaca austrocitrina]